MKRVRIDVFNPVGPHERGDIAWRRQRTQMGIHRVLRSPKERPAGYVGRHGTTRYGSKDLGLEAHRHNAPARACVQAKESAIPERSLLKWLAGIR